MSQEDSVLYDVCDALREIREVLIYQTSALLALTEATYVLADPKAPEAAEEYARDSFRAFRDFVEERLKDE